MNEQHILAVANADIKAGSIVCLEFPEDGSEAAYVKQAEGVCFVRFVAQSHGQ